MRLFLIPRSAALAAALITSVVAASVPAFAVTAPSRATLGVVDRVDAMVPVHFKSGDHHVHYRHAKRHRHHDHIVDAPFTRVRSGRRVDVDAPFTTVTVTRHGRHVRAPFVDLWVPRGR